MSAIHERCDACFFSNEIGLRKPDSECYRHVVEQLGVPPEEIVFFDDSQECVIGARASGLPAYQCAGIDALRVVLRDLGILPNSAQATKPMEIIDMTESTEGVSHQAYPYTTKLDIQFAPLEVVDLQPIVASVRPWFNQTLCQVNDSVVRLGVVQGEYHWHKHDADDEFFYVVEGQLLIDLEHENGRTVELTERQGFVVPKGVVHRTRANVPTVILMVENAGIIPTGD